jgi:hypothetical protein
MNGLFIFVAIVILSAIIGAVSQALKNQQQAEQARRAQARAANRGGGGAGRAGASDIDRFLEEIDKLRRKSASGERERPPTVPVARRAPRPTPAEVPTVAPRKPRLSEEATRTFEVTAAPPRAVPLPRVEELPVATARPIGTPAPQPRAKTEFATQLGTLLGSQQALPLAVVLQEVLGPPKSKRA